MGWPGPLMEIPYPFSFKKKNLIKEWNSLKFKHQNTSKNVLSLLLKSNCDLVNIEHTCKDGGNIEKISTLSHMSYYSQA